MDNPYQSSTAPPVAPVDSSRAVARVYLYAHLVIAIATAVAALADGRRIRLDSSVEQLVGIVGGLGAALMPVFLLVLVFNAIQALRNPRYFWFAAADFVIFCGHLFVMLPLVS